MILRLSLGGVDKSVEKLSNAVWRVRVSGEEAMTLGGGRGGRQMECRNEELRVLHCRMPFGVRHGSRSE